jgi:choline dehydrogenase-like flavoprotein
MNLIDVEGAAKRSWGAVVVGTSFAAMFFARSLRRPSPILFVEKGGLIPHAEQLRARRVGREEAFRQTNTSGTQKKWIAHSQFGGNSNCWWGSTPRFHPDDFALRSRHGVGVDWPINYEDLEPRYCEVEELMDVAGGGSDHLLPRSRPFPARPHAPSLSDLVLQSAGGDWFAQPTARSNGSRRPKCCANGVCHLCPIDSKFTILNSLESFARPDCYLLLGTEARQLHLAGGVGRSLVVRQERGGRTWEVKADLFALGANAIFNAGILLRSGFQSPHLGRYLHEQVSQIAYVDIGAANYFGGTSITGHGYAYYAGAHRSQAAAVLLENWNAPPSIRAEKGKWTHRLMIKTIAEDLPRVENAVTLEDDEPAIRWSGHSQYSLDGLARVRELLPHHLPFAVEGVRWSSVLPTESHILGTTRMAENAAEGVVDRNLVTFEARNVLSLGGGVFPSCSPANPTLTLSALSLRAADAIS